MMSSYCASSVESCLFHSACFHSGLIDPRWAVSELSATPAEPTEIGFLLALEHCYVKGTTAQPKHTPSCRWLRALDCPPLLTHRNILCLMRFAGFTALLSSPLQQCALIDTIKGSLKSFSGLRGFIIPFIFLKQLKTDQRKAELVHCDYFFSDFAF